jgi:hypothetical protein
VLLTRAPLYRGRSPFSCDLHVLGAPLTFVLSQDQTLQLNLVSSRVVAARTRWQSSGSGLETESRFGQARHRCGGRGPRALQGPTRRRLARTWPKPRAHGRFKASVRFSFQGPREPAGSEVGGETVGGEPVLVKRSRRFFCLAAQSVGRHLFRAVYAQQEDDTPANPQVGVDSR